MVGAYSPHVTCTCILNCFTLRLYVGSCRSITVMPMLIEDYSQSQFLTSLQLISSLVVCEWKPGKGLVSDYGNPPVLAQ